jgi:type VI secretion system protein ImpK
MALRARMETELRRFEERAYAKGVDPRQVQLGNYVLCALVDDIVLNTPWGAAGAWKSASLAGTLHHDVAAGERFFDVLEQARSQAAQMRPLLELMSCCLAMGFEGRYRLAAGGAETLSRLRLDLGTMLAGSDRDARSGEELSPAWRGVPAEHKPIGQRIPLWVLGAGALALLALVYVGFNLRLGAYSERLGPIVGSLPPTPPVQLVRAAAVAIPPPPPPIVRTPLSARLAGCLRAAGVSTDAVTEDFQKVRVTLPNAGLFASGSAELSPAVVPLVRCLGNELAKESGRILVVGHSDNVPIHTARFPSNWELSKARAAAVEQDLAAVVPDPGRIGVEGRADTEPVASNATEAGRAANRRVEILLLR